MNAAAIHTERVRLDTADGPMHAYVARPTEAARPPGIIVFQEAFGVTAHIRDVTERFARLGLVAIAPELFHRTADGYEGAYDDFDALKPHLAATSQAGVAGDARAAYDWLCAHAGADRIGAVGFCMGGMAAYVSNAHLPLRAAISFYGTGPLELAAKQHGPLLMFWGGADAHIRPETYRPIADALTAAGAEHEQVVFSSAGHGFFRDVGSSYVAGAAAQAWALVQAFLRYCAMLQ